MKALIIICKAIGAIAVAEQAVLIPVGYTISTKVVIAMLIAGAATLGSLFHTVVPAVAVDPTGQPGVVEAPLPPPSV